MKKSMTGMNKLRVLITGSNATLDNGEAALIITAIETIKREVEHTLQSNVEFRVGSNNWEVDSRRYQRMLPTGYNLKVVTGTRSSKAPLFIRTFFLLFRYIVEYLRADIGVHIGTDGYNDDNIPGYLGLLSSLWHSCQLAIPLFLGKPVVIYSSSIGPFITKPTRFLARFILNNVTFVMVREQISREYLQRLGVSNHVFLTADSAFVLRPAPIERVKTILEMEGITVNDRPLIGLAVSQIIHQWTFPEFNSARKYQKYVELMVSVADFVTNMGATVLLISHNLGARGADDRIVAEKIYSKTKHKCKVKILTGEYIPQELKGVIGQCDMLVACKTHAMIAGTSMCIPTIGVAYSHKTHGIIGRMLGQERFVVDVRNYASLNALLSVLFSKIESAWFNRNQIRKEMEERVKHVQALALLNAELVVKAIASANGY